MQKSIIRFLIFTIYYGGIFSPANVMSEELIQRNVLFEMFTGTWCGACPYGEDAKKKLINRFDNLITIVYHVDDPMGIEQSKQLDKLVNQFYPGAMIDRTRFSGGESIVISRDSWEKSILERSEVQSPISIELEGSFKPDTRKMNVTAVFCTYEDIYAELRVNVIVIEDSLNYKQKIYNKPYKEIDPYYHMQVVRDMVTGFLGEPLNDKPLKKQVCIRKNYVFTLKENIIPKNSHIVVFVHENESMGFGAVYQSAIIPVTGSN
jgi:hypothetical protein